MSSSEIPKSLLKGYLLLANVLNSTKIEKLLVPPIVQSGSTNVVLDCQYSVSDGPLTVQWWFNGGGAPVYEWTPPLMPRVKGIFEGRLDLSYKVSQSLIEQYRALRIIRVDPQLSGAYTCVVVYNKGMKSQETKSMQVLESLIEQYRALRIIRVDPQLSGAYTCVVVYNKGMKSQETKSMQVLAPEKEFELLFEHKFNRLVEVTCYVHSVHPQPDLTVEYNNKPISQQTQRSWRRNNLLYDVESTAQLAVPVCSDRIEVTCRLHLPQADYTAIKKRLLHFGPVKCNHGWNDNSTKVIITLSLIIILIVK